MKYIAFLRGINIGKHHKVPMAELRIEFKKLGFNNIVTVLNSGNVIFDAEEENEKKMAKTISNQLEKAFGFEIIVFVISANTLQNIIKKEPFKNIEITKDIRLYITFTNKKINSNIDEELFKIVALNDYYILNIIDLSVTNTIKGMKILEKIAGKDITTRNWNTILRINKKL